MAHIVLTIEPDPRIRRIFLQRAKAILSEECDLDTDSAESGDMAVVWAWGGQAPVDFSENTQGCSLLLGYALDQRDRKLDAGLLLKEWTEQRSDRHAWDGYFASLRYSENVGLAVDVDPMGLFPMFVYQQNGAFIVGSSGALFEAHSRFQSQLDPVGLAGILLTNGLVNEQTLLKDVRQLRAGCRLFRSPEGFISEIRTREFNVSSCEQNRPYQQILTSVNEEIKTAIKRHQPDNCSTTLLLSGGMDSRLMGGYLKRLGLDVPATTFGRSTDFEVRMARRVAHCLKIPLERKPGEYSQKDLVRTVRRVARMEHLTHGFSGAQEPCSNVEVGAPMFWSGYHLDDILGGSPVNFAWDRQTRNLNFETFFRNLNNWGLCPKDLTELMRPILPDGEDVVSGLIQTLRNDWNEPDRSDTQKALRMKLATRGRYHLAGVVHRMSFISWPILPFNDIRFLDEISQLPFDAVFERRLQRDLMDSYFPELNGLPFDTNSFRFGRQPKYAPTSKNRLRASLLKVRESVRSWYWLELRKTEPRRYYRLFDPDLPDWQVIRRAAEPCREGILAWLDEAQLAVVVPAPDTDLHYANPFFSGASLRTLCGLMLWKASSLGQTRKAA